MNPAKTLLPLRSLLSKLRQERQEYDFLPPSHISHAAAYASDMPRLRKYAAEVIPARVLLFMASSKYSTQFLVQTFLQGADTGNPMPMLLAARSQIELLAVVADVCRILRENAGQHIESFVERVTSIDQALINAFYGTRSTDLKEALRALGGSRIREIDGADIAAVSAKNILTRLDRLSKLPEFSSCKTDYERLCEFVHPNWGMNLMTLEPSPRDPRRFLRLSASSATAPEKALRIAIGPMTASAKATATAFDDLHAPFGMGGRFMQ